MHRNAFECSAITLISAKIAGIVTKLKKEISSRLLKSKLALPKERPFEIYDTRLTGFGVRVQPSGRRSYFVRWGRSNRKTIGTVGILTPFEARDRAQRVLGNLAHGREPDHGLVGTGSRISLGAFIDGQYRDWADSHYTDPNSTLDRLRRCFRQWYESPIADISPAMLDRWIADRLRSGISGATVNRDLCVLGAALNRAVTWQLLPQNPVRKVAKCRVDKMPKTRYLSPDERSRLVSTLRMRDDQKRQKRLSFNQWRKARGRSLLPPIGTYCDHLTPMVLLSLNTGCRRGELYSLTWSNVDLQRQLLTVSGRESKNGQTRVVNLNSEATSVLQNWGKQSRSVLVFPSSNGRPLSYIKTAWSKVLRDAQIKNFRWHDLRHTFASNLVMAKVDLNTVRELLGHSDIAMTLRYAHLNSHHKAAAVQKLCA